MLKRLLALSLVAVMVFAMAACNNAGTPSTSGGGDSSSSGGSSSGGANEPSSDLAPYEIVYNVLSNEMTEDRVAVQDKLNEIIGPRFNATIKLNMIVWGDWDAKANVPLAAGEKVDITFTADWHNYMRSISQNQFLPLNDPNSEFGDLIATYAADAAALLGDSFLKGAQVDGINYGFPTNKELTVPAGYIFNEDIATKYNLDVKSIKSLDDIGPMLEVVKAGEDADFIPYLTDGNWYASPFMSPSSQFGDAVMYNDPKADGTFDETISLNWEHPDYQAFLTTMRDYYVKGYIHPDAYLDTHNIGDFRNAGKFFIESQPLKGHDTKSSELEASSGNPDLHLDEVQIQVPTYLTTHAGGSMLAIPYTSDDPARAMMFINLMHSDEQLLNTMVWGVEGKNYEKVSATVVKNTSTPWSNKHGGAWTMGNQFLQWTGDNENPDKYTLLKEFSGTGIPHPTLGFRFRPEAVENEMAAYSNANTGMARSLKTGAVDPAVELQKHIDNLKAAGSDKIVEEIRSQYETWKSK